MSEPRLRPPITTEPGDLVRRLEAACRRTGLRLNTANGTLTVHRFGFSAEISLIRSGPGRSWQVHAPDGQRHVFAAGRENAVAACVAECIDAAALSHRRKLLSAPHVNPP